MRRAGNVVRARSQRDVAPLVVGALGGQISAATKIAMHHGAKVAHVDTIEQATGALRNGRGADLLEAIVHRVPPPHGQEEAPLRALIFDFDGTIIDSETPVYDGWRATYAEHGHELPLERYVEIIGTAALKAWEQGQEAALGAFFDALGR